MLFSINIFNCSYILLLRISVENKSTLLSHFLPLLHVWCLTKSDVQNGKFTFAPGTWVYTILSVLMDRHHSLHVENVAHGAAHVYQISDHFGGT